MSFEPFAVILIPQSREKDLCSSLRVNSARNLAVVWGGRNQSEIPLPQLRDRNDIEPAGGKSYFPHAADMALGLKNSWNYDWAA